MRTFFFLFFFFCIAEKSNTSMCLLLCTEPLYKSTSHRVICVCPSTQDKYYYIHRTGPQIFTLHIHHVHINTYNWIVPVEWWGPWSPYHYLFIIYYPARIPYTTYTAGVHGNVLKVFMHVWFARASCPPHRSSKLWPLHNCLCNVTICVVSPSGLVSITVDIHTLTILERYMCIHRKCVIQTSPPIQVSWKSNWPLSPLSCYQPDRSEPI